VVKYNITKKVNWMWKADCTVSSVNGSNSNGVFPVGAPEEHIYTVPPRTIEDLMTRLKQL
jgi:hypothetical protein